MDMLPDQIRGGKFTGLQKAIKCQGKGCPDQPYLQGENDGSWRSFDFNVRRTLMVMGRRVWVGTPCDLLMPVHNRWRSLSFVGSSRPLSKCSRRILARYTLMVFKWLVFHK